MTSHTDEDKSNMVTTESMEAESEEAPAEKPAPAPKRRGRPPKAAKEKAAPKEPKISASDAASFEQEVQDTFRILNAGPKETVRVPLVNGPQLVILNGARWNIPANVPVEVPKRIAEMLRESERI